MGTPRKTFKCALCTVDDTCCFHDIRLGSKTSVFHVKVIVVSTASGCVVINCATTLQGFNKHILTMAQPLQANHSTSQPSWNTFATMETLVINFQTSSLRCPEFATASRPCNKHRAVRFCSFSVPVFRETRPTLLITLGPTDLFKLIQNFVNSVLYTAVAL